MIALSMFMSGPGMSCFRGTGHHPWNGSGTFPQRRMRHISLEGGPFISHHRALDGLMWTWTRSGLCYLARYALSIHVITLLEIIFIFRIIISSRCKSLAVTMQLGSLANDQQMPRGGSQLKPPTERILSVNAQVLGLLLF